MIISKTPFRVSFFGGGTDYPDYYNTYGGRTLLATIDKYCYISLRRLPPFFDHKYRVVYSQVEHINNIEEIEHPSVRETIRYTGFEEGLEVTHFGDLPARTGLGSSSSFTVGLLNALYAYQGKYISKQQLAREAIYIEQEMIGENVGSQDQTAAAYGGFNIIDFSSKEIVVTPCIIPNATRKSLSDNLVIVYTGLSRIASEIVSEQIRTIEKKLKELEEIKRLVDVAISILTHGIADDFGRLLHETWMIKRGLTERITNPEIDELYNAAIECGALGGKLLGAGGGGFLLFYVPESAKLCFVERFKKLVCVPVSFDNDGTRIIYYTEDVVC